MWVKCGNVTLSHKEKTVIANGRQLTDIHINAAQNLMKTQFKQLNPVNTLTIEETS